MVGEAEWTNPFLPEREKRGGALLSLSVPSQPGGGGGSSPGLIQRISFEWRSAGA